MVEHVNELIILAQNNQMSQKLIKKQSTLYAYNVGRLEQSYPTKLNMAVTRFLA